MSRLTYVAGWLVKVVSPRSHGELLASCGQEDCPVHLVLAGQKCSIGWVQ